MQKAHRVLGFLDLLFLNRNKAYGAYELRTRYPSRLRKAAGGVLFSTAMLSLLPFLMSALSGNKTSREPLQVDRPVVLADVPTEVVKPPVEIEPPKPTAVASQQHTVPKIVPNEDAHEEDVLQERDTALQISSVDKAGERNPTGETLPTGDGKTKGTWVEGPTTKPPSDEPAIIVDIQPQFPGDVREYLASKLQYPDQARVTGIEGRVVVRFVVDEKGQVTNATIVRGLGGGCDEEALRVVRSMPRWTPAKLNGETVKAYFSLPIKFTLEG